MWHTCLRVDPGDLTANPWNDTRASSFEKWGDKSLWLKDRDHRNLRGQIVL
jgi:hypothetical protein